MITCRLYREGTLEEEAFDPARVSDLIEEHGSRVWLDVADPSEQDLAMLQEEFGLHPLAIEDTMHRGQRPKVEVYEGYFFLVLHAVSMDEKDELGDSEIHAFAGHRFLITLRYPPVFDLAEVLRRWDRQPELTSEGGGFLLYALLDEVVDGYFEVVERLEDLSDEIEDRVFADEPDQSVQEDIFRLKRRVVEFRRLVLPLREVLDLVQEQPQFVSNALGPYYRDVADHVIRTLEFADNVRELLTAALEAQLSQVSNRLNVVMKQLTSWAGIVLVPTLIAGIYGMNFEHMPELHWKYGYLYALLLMAASMFTLYRVFKKRDWL
ncbi:MAG: magnesium/cobalt transporter CorA [Actinomycetota bacterium]